METSPCLSAYNIEMDYQNMMNRLNALSDAYDCLSITGIGQSILGRTIPMISLGEGKTTVLYVGAHHGMEWITSSVLLRFIHEYCRLKKYYGFIYKYNLEYLYKKYTIHIIPMLNPDGVEYQIHGIHSNHLLYSRVISMNGGSHDFSSWQANARGVDLNHNYAAGFWEYKKLEKNNGIEGGAPTRYSGEEPESEPEVGAISSFLRYNETITGVLTLHTQGEEIYFKSGKKALPGTYKIAKNISEMTGYRIGQPDGPAAYGGLTDWCIEELEIPSFTLECGKGKNPLPIKDWFSIYIRLRKLLFSFPTLFKK